MSAQDGSTITRLPVQIEAVLISVFFHQIEHHHTPIEAVLIGTLFHQSTMALMCIAVERYVCILHPLRYDAIMTHRRCVVMVAGTWAVTFVCYAAIVLAARLFYFDSVGATCEPFYGNPTLTFSVIGLFYVPPLVVLVFCYGRIYLVTRQQVRRIAAQAEYINGLSHPSDSAASETEVSRGVLTSVVTVAIVGFNVLGMCVVHSDHYRRHMRDQARMLLTSLACTDLAMGVLVTPFCIYPSVYECWPFSEWFCQMGRDGQPRRHCRAVKSSKTPAAIALGFFIAVTPWTLSQLIPLGGTPVNATLDFLLTWLALSNSFWNVVIYGIISKSYRNAASKLLVDLVHKNRGSSVRPAIASVPANSGRHDAPPVLALEQGSVEPMELQSC
ncbi:PREDICTED: 5-hydroxytryptamine receptor 1A-like [Priapulus caudatus]|uniref:5-hydroxytryptamine receptor 1A-like n=1 Tax=Priapulus caudatus TaxID=37621 RepID=A0ABM1E5S7_PRICU|nr:PREDICTED: 5-hydroxytryptamine receptor 1A-like [Priapulus caudatus]